MSDNNSLEAAIQKGLDAGRAYKTQQEANALTKTPSGKLSATYNAASGLLAGLKILHDRQDSKFEYKVNESLSDDVLRVSTNIPVDSCLFTQVKLLVTVKSNGEITAHGDTDKHYNTEIVHTENGEAAPILEFVAKQAVLKGLVR